MDLIKEDPPAGGSNRKLVVKYADELAKVKTEPGEWFRLFEYSALGAREMACKAASTLRSQAPGFEFRAAKGRVYVRWIG